MDILIQMIGYIGMFCSVYSFQRNSHKSILLFQIFANSCFMLQYFLLGAFTGSILNLIALLRSIVFYNQGKKWSDFKLWPYIFCVMFVILGLFTYSMPLTIAPLIDLNIIHSNLDFIKKFLPLIPILAMVINTFTFASPKPKITRQTILISSPGWLIYGFISGSWGGFLNECFTMTSTLIAIFRFDIKPKLK